MEENGYVLDYLPQGKSNDVHREPLAYIIGEKFFTLLEAVIKPGSGLKAGDRVYIGKELTERKDIERIKGRINHPAMTSSARSELKNIIKMIVMEREKEMVNFFNKSGPITIRQHQLELLPGVGKKHLREILDEREKQPFESFEDISNRIPHFQNPAAIIVDRIIDELMGSRYYLFTRPPAQDRPPSYGRSYR